MRLRLLQGIVMMMMMMMMMLMMIMKFSVFAHVMSDWIWTWVGICLPSKPRVKLYVILNIFSSSNVRFCILELQMDGHLGDY